MSVNSVSHSMSQSTQCHTRRHGQLNVTVDSMSQSTHALGVVMDLMRKYNLLNKGYHFYTDNVTEREYNDYKLKTGREEILSLSL